MHPSNYSAHTLSKAAHIIYDDQKNATAAAAAKHELSQIFTKTLTVQVWRPEHERPGRHFVYTTRYVYFFVSLLDELDDRPSMDQLLRRVRKKQGDFLNHTKLWEDICLTYAKMIRRAANINEAHEENVFRPIGWEEFSTKTARLEALKHLTPESLPLLELIRDSLELKKLNNNLMKVTMFEDLIADLYARVYEVNMPSLMEQANEENKEKMKVNHLLMTGDGTTDSSTPATSLPASDTPAPRGRTKGIARRDIQKRADTIVNLKLGPRAAATKFTATADSEQASSNQRDQNAGSFAPTSAPRRPSKQASGAEGSASVQQREHNGVQDSGDESGLSDVDESKLESSTESKPLFPNLNNEESGVGETEGDDGESGVEGAEEEGEDDEGEYDDNDEGDAAATEAETNGDDAREGDEADDEEIQDGDADDRNEDGPESDGRSNAGEDTGTKDKSPSTQYGRQDVPNSDPMDVSSASNIR